MTHSLRAILALITLNGGLLFGLCLPTQAQGLKTNSGSFGSGWQVGGTGGDSGGSYGSAGSASSSSGSYGSYAGGSTSADPASSGTSGYSGAMSGSGGSGTYGGYGGGYGSSTPPVTSEAPVGTPYAAPRSAGGGLRAQ